MVDTFTGLLAFPNYSDVDYYTPIISGGVWQSGAPASNLQNRFFANKARTINCSIDNTQFVVDLSINRDVRVVVIPSSNLTKSSYVVINLYDASMSLLSTNTIEPYPVIFKFGTIPFFNPSFWDGKVTEENKNIYPFPILLVLPNAVICRYVQVIIYDTNNPDGYIELTRLFVAPGWQPGINFNYGAKIGLIDPTIVTTSLGGADFFDKRIKRRIANIEFQYLNRDEAFANALDMQMRLGISGQIFFCYDPTDTANLHRISFIATMSQLDPLTATALNLQGVVFSLKEVVA